MYLNENHLRHSKFELHRDFQCVNFYLSHIMKFANEREILSGKYLRAAQATAHRCYCSDAEPEGDEGEAES